MGDPKEEKHKDEQANEQNDGDDDTSWIKDLPEVPPKDKKVAIIIPKRKKSSKEKKKPSE